MKALMVAVLIVTQPSSVPVIYQAHDDRYLFVIPPLPADQALQLYQQQAGLTNIIYSSHLKPIGWLPELYGWYSREEAIRILLARSCLRGEAVNEWTYALTSSGGPCAWIDFPVSGPDCVPVMDSTVWGRCPNDSHMR